MEYFVCPKEIFCGQALYVAQAESQYLEINTELFNERRMCSYEIRFSLDAGHLDILNLQITNAASTQLAFAIGTKFENAVGKILNYPEGTIIKVRYPYRVFVTFMHADWAVEAGNFAFKYWFLDQADGRETEFLADIYEIQLGEYEQTNYMPYIIALAALLLLVILIFGLWIYYMRQKKINSEAMRDRKQGVAQWGTKSAAFADGDEDAMNKIISQR